LNNEDLENEVVRKRGNTWVIFDDETDVELGSFPQRNKAWERQRQIRRSQLARRKAKAAERQRQARAGRPEVEKKPGIKRAKGSIAANKRKKEESIDYLKGIFKEVLKENFLRYVFEQPQNDQKTLMWDKFIENLSNETLMSDQKLKNILKNLIASESKLLDGAYKQLESVLNKTGNFRVKSPQKKNENSELVLTFNVEMKEAKKTLPVSIRVESGRPLVHLPDDTRNELNSMGSPDSKLLNGELVHVQETIFNKMDDVVKIAEKRDNYLMRMEQEIDKLITDMSPLQISMVKFLIKTKYRGIK